MNILPPELLVQIGADLNKLDAILLSMTCWCMYEFVRGYLHPGNITSRKDLWYTLAKHGYLSLLYKLSRNNRIRKFVIKMAI